MKRAQGDAAGSCTSLLSTAASLARGARRKVWWGGGVRMEVHLLMLLHSAWCVGFPLCLVDALAFTLAYTLASKSPESFESTSLSGDSLFNSVSRCF